VYVPLASTTSAVTNDRSLRSAMIFDRSAVSRIDVAAPALVTVFFSAAFPAASYPMAVRVPAWYAISPQLATSLLPHACPPVRYVTYIQCVFYILQGGVCNYLALTMPSDLPLSCSSARG
jgi:hypothetical protein